MAMISKLFGYTRDRKSHFCNPNLKFQRFKLGYRYLTFEGKSLITKAFGLSQLIYSLQVLEVRKLCIIRIERSSFGFLWIGCRSEKEKGIDRIKRSVLKNGYEYGGLNITDVDCLNK